ncbi:spermidine hydroxycinnamoyl transferase [Cajanus cajan]|uniref:spermidine hydroxycinnamoyl transferase n=1 Tax=Cajanus cajan TaxID=3821 RepID=UPI00098DCC5A|nr:spermidine hydroxycinnamoyl transferase [Cajanus cajan]
MLNIVASYCVVPSEETPETRLRLSDYDQVVRLGHTPNIYIYKAKHNHNTTEKMIKSLSKILVFYYPIAGRLSLAESGRMELDCNAKGVTFLEAETTKSMSDYGDFSPSESIKELVPKIDYTTQPIEELPLLFVQLTRLFLYFATTNEGVMQSVVKGKLIKLDGPTLKAAAGLSGTGREKPQPFNFGDFEELTTLRDCQRNPVNTNYKKFLAGGRQPPQVEAEPGREPEAELKPFSPFEQLMINKIDVVMEMSRKHESLFSGILDRFDDLDHEVRLIKTQLGIPEDED